MTYLLRPPSRPLGRSCLSAFMAALLVNTACTTPLGRAPPHGQRSSSPRTAPTIVDAAQALYSLYEESRTAESAGALVAASERFGRAASGTVVRILAMLAKVFLKGHWGPHPELYHQEVFRRIRLSLGRCATPSTCRPLLEAALRNLAADICTPGSALNLLIAEP